MKWLKISVKLFVLVINLIIFSSVIWIFSPNIVWNDEIPFESKIARSLLIAVFISVLSIVYLLFFLQKKTEKNNNTVSEIHLKKLKDVIKKCIKHITSSLKIMFRIWSSKHRQNLCKLPWYLLLGMPHSGKSTLLASSDLDFSLNKILNQQLFTDEILRGEYQWHFSNQAVFLEVNSQQFDKSEQQDDFNISLINPFWNGLLKMIKSYRRNNPINGLIVAINISELLLQTEKINLSRLKLLKSILFNIHHQLNITVPVYIVFTQCDLIAGFTEFFVNLTQEEKQQSCSIYVGNDYENFEAYYNEFIQKLNEQLLIKIHNERDQEKRDLILSLPQQMLLFKSIAKNYLLQENYAKTRGFYFTSALQTGVSYNFLGSVISKKYHLSVNNKIKTFASEQGLFVKQLFTKNILIDKPIIKNNVSIRKLHQLIAVIIFMGISLLIKFSYIENKQAIDQLKQTIREYQKIQSNINSNNSSLLHILPFLDILKSAQDIYTKADHYLLLNFEFYATVRIKNYLEKIWHANLENQFLPRVADLIEYSLKNNQNNREVLYQTLKAYLALANSDKAEKKWIQSPLNYNLYQLKHYQFDDISKINTYLNEAISYPIKPLLINQALVQKTSQLLQALKPSELAYYE